MARLYVWLCAAFVGIGGVMWGYEVRYGPIRKIIATVRNKAVLLFKFHQWYQGDVGISADV